MRAAAADAGAGARASSPAQRQEKPLALALLAGVLQAFSIAAPWSGQPLWWLQLLSLGAFVSLLDRVGGAGWRRGALLGWVFAAAWLAATWWWMTVSMHRYGGLPAPLAWIAVLLLAGLLALYYAFVCGVFCKLFRPSAPANPALCASAFAALWLLAELMRGVWFTGLPWGAGGYAQIDGPLARIAPLAGVYAMTAAAAWLAALVALRGRAWRLRAGAAALLLTALAFVPNPSFTASAGALRVTLLQGNIAQSEKFEANSGIPAALAWYAQQLTDAGGDLVVTPETALPLLPRYLPAGYLDAIRTRFDAGVQAALVGIPLPAAGAEGSRRGYTNSALGFAPGQPQQEGAPYRYDKHHLVPFGEFVPPFARWFVDMMHIPLGDFDRGGVGQRSFAWKDQRLAPNICYEDLFSEELGQRFADAAAAPTILVNMSNIAWFGDTVAIDQHLQMSRLRALEFERPVIRATNTGATAVIDARGRVVRQLPRLTQGVLVADVEGRTGNTPYADWVSKLRLWPFWAVALLVPLAAWLALRRCDAS